MNDKKVNSEVYGVLKTLDSQLLNRLPQALLEYIKNNSDESLIPNIKKGTPLKDMPISRDAQAFITLLNLQYFCQSTDEKKQIIDRIVENEKNEQKAKK